MLKGILTVWYFLKFVACRFFEDSCGYRAAALTFTTLLALVPLMTLGFAIFSLFPAFQSIGQQIQTIIFSNFVASSAATIQSYLQQFVQQGSRLSVASISLLLVTAVLMMFTIEESFNVIWRVPRQRRFISAFLLYWAVLTVSPLLMSLGFLISSYVISFKVLNQTVQQLNVKHLLLDVSPVLLSMVVFSALYQIVPNCRVPLRASLVGGFCAAILFELSKKGFALYVLYFSSTEILYGAWAAIPLFLIWVYVSWLIVLGGAIIASGLTNGWQNPVLSRWDHLMQSVKRFCFKYKND